MVQMEKFIQKIKGRYYLTYPITSTFATKCVHLLPVGPILSSAGKIQGSKQNLILKPFDIQSPKK